MSIKDKLGRFGFGFHEVVDIKSVISGKNLKDDEFLKTQDCEYWWDMLNDGIETLDGELIVYYQIGDDVDETVLTTMTQQGAYSYKDMNDLLDDESEIGLSYDCEMYVSENDEA